MKRKSLLFSVLLAMMGAVSAQAQKYYPTTRATTIEPGKQYMIFDASRYDNQSRQIFRAPNGSGGFKGDQTYPASFITADATYLWTVEEISAEKTANHTYYLKTSLDTYAGPGGVTNNTSAKEIVILPWADTNDDKKACGAKDFCVAPDGSTIDPVDITPEMGFFVIGNGNNGGNNWNGNDGGSFATWGTGHPYCFYEIATISQEVIDAYAELEAVAATVPVPVVDYFALQTSYGVKDAAKYVCSNPELGDNTDNSLTAAPISNLIDNNTSTFYHTSWSNSGSTPHYITVEMAEAVDAFYFYMAPRNGNNRPKDVTISGCNTADGEFVNIADVNGISMDNGYLSYKISSATAYQYLRFTVNATNTSTRFFTLSEFYVLPSNSDIDNVLGEYFDALIIKDISALNPANNRAVTIEEINARTTDIGLLVTKAEAKELLDANKTNHAEVPALGQYTTAMYNALQAAYDGCTLEAGVAGVDALVTAMNAFVPNYAVFTINSNQSSYGVGKSIYDDGQASHHFKAKDATDARMLWKFSTTSTTVTAGTYEVSNIATGRKFWNADHIVVYDNVTPETEGVFTFKTNGTGGEVHAQEANSVIVRWGDKGATGGSAWTFEYVSDAYSLEKIGIPYYTAYYEAQSVYNSIVAYKDNTTIFGNAVGQVPETVKEAIVSACGAYETTINDKNVFELYEAGVAEDDIVAVVDQLAASIEGIASKVNQPADGKAYKIYVHYPSGKAVQPLYFSGTRIAAKDEGNIADPNSMIFICRKVGEEFVFVNHAGKYLVWCDNGDTSGKSVSNDGYTDVYEEKNKWIINTPAQWGGDWMQYLGYVYMAATCKDDVGRYLTARWEGEDVDCDFVSGGEYGWYYDDNGGKPRTPLFSMVEVAYPAAYTPSLVEPANLDVDGIATWSAPCATVLPDGVEAYIAVEATNSYVSMQKVEGSVIPANTGVLITGAAGAATILPAVGETAADVTGNIFENTAGAAAAHAGALVLAKDASDNVAFHPVNATPIKMNKAYLPAAGGGVRQISFDFATGIQNVETEQGTSVKTYDLSGRLVQKATKGIFIQNGKKVILK